MYILHLNQYSSLLYESKPDRYDLYHTIKKNEYAFKQVDTFDSFFFRAVHCLL